MNLHRSADVPPGTDALLRTLQAWVDAGWLRAVDAAFAGFLAREAPDADAALLLAAALASHQLGRGHPCLVLGAVLRDPVGTLDLPPEGWTAEAAGVPSAPEPPAALLAGLDAAGWASRLRHPALVGAGEGAGPLVLEDGRLYLRRYWEHERVVRAGIAARLDDAQGPPAAALREVLDALFPGDAGPEAFDWQKAACAVAVRRRIGVITGGPGTGKTTTVVKLLAALQHLALGGQLAGRAAGRPLRIRLAAPTGKAAARLNESIAGAVRSLPLQALPEGEAVRAAIPTQVVTLHRLLGSLPHSRHFRHHAGQPLPLDVLVLDEASMVDLEMMAALLQALPPAARLILLGDKDQLASVEAGAVLGALCRRADAGHYTPATRQALAELTGQRLPEEFVDPQGLAWDQAVVKLRRSWRFQGDSGIGQLAEAVNAGRAEALPRLARRRLPDLAFVWLPRDPGALRQLALHGTAAGASTPDLFDGPTGPLGHAHYLRLLQATQPALDASPEALDAWARGVLAAFGEFQLLCAVRRGPQGVEQLNRQVGAWLCEAGLLGTAQGWSLGRPVMVTRNDYALGLMNGDVGITLATPVPDAGGELQWKLRVAFAGGGANQPVRWVLPSRLSSVETVFAMTVHKSQGSEFSHAALVLPAQDSRVLTRELVYTGITRARRWFTLVSGGDERLLAQAVSRRLERSGGPLA
ncbi:exodeoxyribonuclease V subunit alpha [Ramlibacter rhizophilus]|uniref:RecBCD enzyme subunit RecD n=1 Tax=Ramlibacter rhizophilus TaxID=1781167 RepID=A0A4Z0C1I3_9BURK|nr:exodeoxyribonuclease V subunit alpha [Ramlibacter rhizophilus]TFZ04378.1 exodeoxyribonuclease V subunit alpha [Ramlibacter rhizophilus]